MIIEDKVQGVIVNVLREKDNSVEYLYLQRSGGKYKGHWWPVGGTCDKEETPLECAIRELKEETNLDVLSIFDLGIKVPHIDQVSKLVGYVAFVDKEQQVMLNHEHKDFKWMQAHETCDFLPEYTHVFVKHIEENFIKVKPKISDSYCMSPIFKS